MATSLPSIHARLRSYCISARPGCSRCRSVRSCPTVGVGSAMPSSDSSVGGRSIWLTMRVSRRASMPPPRINPGIWKLPIGTMFLPNTRESWSATTRNTVSSQYGEAIALRKNSPSA
ncbi:hypothetical protein D3C72_1820420 [compost metagenome]